MFTQPKYTYTTNVDLTKLVVGQLQKLGIHPDGLAGKALFDQNKQDNADPNSTNITELIKSVGKSTLQIMTVYCGRDIKAQTLTLFKDDIWVLYGYSNETGKGQLVYSCSKKLKKAQPEEAVDIIFQIIDGKTN